jgi:threonine dehydratase
MVTLDEIRAAREVVSAVAIRTPTLPLKSSGRPGVYLKCENLQRAGAFKIRGAFHKISRLPARCPGITASSSGNHAQAVALAASRRGLKAVIVMLDQSVPHKIEATRALGAEVILGGRTSVAIKERAEREAADRGFVYVPPFNDPEIIAGQGTAGLEILEDLPEVRSVVVPVGGGGLLSGIAVAVKESRPDVRVFGAEPEGAPKMTLSLRRGEIVTIPEPQTVADGLKPSRVGELTFEHARRYVDGMALVSDAEILSAARRLLLREKLVVEPSGAAALAAILSGKLSLPEGPAVAVLSGGNADVRAILDSAP